MTLDTALKAGMGLLLGLALGALGGQLWGRAEGAQLARGKAAEQHVKGLQQVLDSHAHLVAEAASASAGLRQALDERSAADDRSTRELRSALARTSGSRAGCVFDDGVVRQLEAARERAAAAAAGGTAATVRGAGAAERSEGR
jgi:hypothetical protein